MRVAFSIWNERIAPVFDVSQQVIILNIEKGKVVERKEKELPDGDHFYKVGTLKNQNVQTLVCGAISRPLAEMAANSGIEVIPFIAGDVERVIEAYIAGGLPDPDLVMPGCCGERHRFQGSRCWRQGRDPHEIIKGKQTPNYERRKAMPRRDGTGPGSKGRGTGQGKGGCGTKGASRSLGRRKQDRVLVEVKTVEEALGLIETDNKFSWKGE